MQGRCANETESGECSPSRSRCAGANLAAVVSADRDGRPGRWDCFVVVPVSGFSVGAPDLYASGESTPTHMPRMEPSSIALAVCDEILSREAVGLAKYGTTVDRVDLSPAQWARHAYEEQLDNAMYTRRLMEDLQPFPMKNGPPLIWQTAAAIYRAWVELKGKAQSLEQIAAGGGFDWAEVNPLFRRLKLTNPVLHAELTQCQEGTRG